LFDFHEKTTRLCDFGHTNETLNARGISMPHDGQWLCQLSEVEGPTPSAIARVPLREVSDGTLRTQKPF